MTIVDAMIKGTVFCSLVYLPQKLLKKLPSNSLDLVLFNCLWDLVSNILSGFLVSALRRQPTEGLIVRHGEYKGRKEGSWTGITCC
jgi:hypothetical protein